MLPNLLKLNAESMEIQTFHNKTILKTQHIHFADEDIPSIYRVTYSMQLLILEHTEEKKESKDETSHL